MATKEKTTLAVALIDLRHLSAAAGCILQGSETAIAALAAAGAVDSGKEAIAHARKQKAEVVNLPDDLPAAGSESTVAA